MAVKGNKRDGPISPALFKFGVALAVSLGGIVFTFLRSKRIMLPKPKPSLSQGKGSQTDSEVGADHSALENTSPNPISSNGGRMIEERDGFLLSDFRRLVEEYDMETPKENEHAENDERDLELRSLRSKVEILEEREKMLENQLLEYYGLKEQEKAVVELQNRLRIHNMEAKLYNLKIESLQLDNRKLQSKVADYEKVVAELESSQAKIKLLRNKLRFEAEQNREQILKLQERVMKMQDQEKKDLENHQDLVSPKEMTRLEEEFEEMKKNNQSLKLENLELAQKVEKLQILAESSLDDKEVQELKEETHLLRQQNEDFRKEIDKLQADRCTDVEELVYLRWINACLRYELRNYQPGPNETIARDLSKSLSPESEEKAKNLILAYANREGSGLNDMSITDFDCEDWSTLSGEADDQENKPNHPNKKRVFAKLMKLLRGKESDHHIQTTSVDDAATTTSSGASSRQSFDLRGRKSGGMERRSYSRRMSDDSSLSIFRTMDSINDGNVLSGFQPGKEAQSAAKNELVKYAEALRSSRPRPSFRRRSVSFGSF